MPQHNLHTNQKNKSADCGSNATTISWENQLPMRQYGLLPVEWQMTHRAGLRLGEALGPKYFVGPHYTKVGWYPRFGTQDRLAPKIVWHPRLFGTQLKPLDTQGTQSLIPKLDTQDCLTPDTAWYPRLDSTLEGDIADLIHKSKILPSSLLAN